MRIEDQEAKVKRRLISALWESIRPHQWLSNLVVFAALVFSRNLFHVSMLAKVAIGFLLLCGLSGAIFTINDVVDRERDRRHPTRRHRPVAAGEISVRQAVMAAALLATSALVGAFILRPAFGLAATGYFVLMLGYSLDLRRRPVLDVLAIAAGLVLRAAAGALLIRVSISPWLYLGVGGLGLILALGRIQYEMRLAAASGTLERDKYTLASVTQMSSVTMTFTLMIYCLYTFLAPDSGPNHMMMFTIPIVIYGLFRYRYLTARQAETQSPERLMLSDTSLLVAVGLWVLTVVGVLYLGRGQ
jgi:4-hydroxybenzoate polyprenyltransferase